MKTRFFALAALALALVACNNDNENLNGDPVAAQFTANIAPATRASGTTWTGGDRIGITDIGNDSQYGNVPFILRNFRPIPIPNTGNGLFQKLRSIRGVRRPSNPLGASSPGSTSLCWTLPWYWAGCTST